MSETLDTVAFDLTGNLATLAKSYAEAEAMTDKLAASIKSKTSSAFFSDTQGGASKIMAARTAMDQLAASTEKSAAAGKKWADAYAKAFQAPTSNPYAEWFKETDKAASGAHGSISTATREFRALFDELTSGRLHMVPGTLAIIATRVFGISAASLALTAVVAAPFIAGAVAAAQYISALDNVQRKLGATGNASGFTREGLMASAAAIAAQPGSRQTSGGAAQGLSILTGRGNIGANLAPGAEQAASGLASVSGGKFDDVAKQFEADLAAPAKGARELNEQMKLLSAGQTREIDDLVRKGDQEGAQKIIIQAMIDRTRDATNSLSGFAQAVDGFKKGLGGFWQDFGKKVAERLGADPSKTDQLKGVDQQILTLDKLLASGKEFGGASAYQANLANLRTEAAQLRMVLKADADKATDRHQQSTDSTAVTNLRDSYGHMFDPKGEKSRDHEDAMAAAAAGVAAAQRILARDQGSHNAGLIGADQRDLAEAQIIAKNAADPNFKPGVGDPKGPKHPGIGSDQAVDNAVKDELEAQLAVTRSIIARAGIQKQIAAIEDKSKDAALRASLTEQHITGAAAERAMAAEKGAQSYRDELATREESEKLQDQSLEYDRSLAGYKLAELKAAESNATTAADRLLVQRQILAQEQTQAVADLLIRQSRDPNLSPAEKARQLNGLMQSNSSAAGALATTPEKANEVAIAASERQVALLNQEAALRHASAEDRVKELAPLQAANELAEEGFSIKQKDYQLELQKRTLEDQTKGLAALQAGGGTDAAQLSDKFREGLSSMALTGVNGFKNLTDVARQFNDEMAQMVLKIGVIDPLLNAMFGTGPTLGGGVIGGLIKTVLGGFGGGKASGGYIDPSQFYVVGENGPEILGPGASGKITPISPGGMTQAPANQNGAVSMTHNVNITVAGNGDAELMARVQTATDTAIKANLHAYDTQAKRNLHANLVQSTKRALV